MTLYDQTEYMEDVQRIAQMHLPWERLAGRSVFLSGAAGMIGSFLTDVILEKNRLSGLNCTVCALVRSLTRARARFSRYLADDRLVLVPCDVNRPLPLEDTLKADYVLHLASNTHPLSYASDPVGTIMTNIVGLKNLLDFSVAHGAVRFLFASSNEIYGENRGDVEFFDEAYCGYINPNTLRAGYPESKRCGEALCQAYRTSRQLEVVIPRLTRSYGPTMLMTDTKAVSQFIKNGIRGEDVVLKSPGNQHYSFLYAGDSVSGILTVLLLGKDGEAYNIADAGSDVTLKELAGVIAEAAGRKVIFESPDPLEAAGYSRATKARLSGDKLRALGWKPMYGLRTGLERTMAILREVSNI